MKILLTLIAILFASGCNGLSSYTSTNSVEFYRNRLGSTAPSPLTPQVVSPADIERRKDGLFYMTGSRTAFTGRIYANYEFGPGGAASRLFINKGRLLEADCWDPQGMLTATVTDGTGYLRTYYEAPGYLKTATRVEDSVFVSATIFNKRGEVIETRELDFGEQSTSTKLPQLWFEPNKNN